VYGIRRKLDHPQVLSSSRHITQGGYELEDVKWADGALSGKLKVVANDPVRLYLYVPDGYQVKSVEPQGTQVQELGTNVVKLTIKSRQTGEVSWKVGF
jgi:hypothetical protein